jgi:streptogramin lyase
VLPRILLVSASLLATACASAPAPMVNVALAPAVRRLAVPGPPPVFLICNAAAAQVSFRAMGVPNGERPLDVAVANGHIYVLFEPARFLRLTPGEAGKLQADMRVGEPDEKWQAMDVDPTDGSVWLASEKFGLLKISCHGAVIWGIATSATEYAAFTTQAVVFGTFATAPDLP